MLFHCKNHLAYFVNVIIKPTRCIITHYSLTLYSFQVLLKSLVSRAIQRVFCGILVTAWWKESTDCIYNRVRMGQWMRLVKIVLRKAKYKDDNSSSVPTPQNSEPNSKCFFCLFVLFMTNKIGLWSKIFICHKKKKERKITLNNYHKELNVYTLYGWDNMHTGFNKTGLINNYLVYGLLILLFCSQTC